MPEIGLLFIVNAFFVIHAVRSGRFWPWAYVIFLLPVVGVAAYIWFEVLPEYRNTPQANRAQAKIVNAVNPERRYRALKADLETADTIGGRVALAQECLALDKYDEALLLYEEIIKSPLGDEPNYHLGKAQAEFGLGQLEPTLATLDELKSLWPQYHSQEGHLLYARALEKLGRDQEALGEYEGLSRYFAGQEVQARRLVLLDRMGRPTEAQAIADEVMRYFKRAPKHARKQQAEWFSVARSYQKHARAKPLG